MGVFNTNMVVWTHDYAVANNQVEIHLAAVCSAETVL
jgi:hypothetical protein